VIEAKKSNLEPSSMIKITIDVALSYHVSDLMNREEILILFSNNFCIYIIVESFKS
jgi:hypothetical protein